MKDIEYKIVHCKDGLGGDVFTVEYKGILPFWRTILREFSSYNSANLYVQNERNRANRNKLTFISEKII